MRAWCPRYLLHGICAWGNLLHSALLHSGQQLSPPLMSLCLLMHCCGPLAQDNSQVRQLAVHLILVILTDHLTVMLCWSCRLLLMCR